jgi:hypothetical protein
MANFYLHCIFAIAHMHNRVARWFVFKPKIPILVKFGGPWNRKCGYIL